MIWRLSAALLAAVAVQACANPGAGEAGQAPAIEAFAKSDWIVAKAWCPIGCSESTRNLLMAQVGGVVHLSASRLDASFIDACEGSVHYSGRTVAPSAIVAEFNKGLAPAQRRLATSDLGLADATSVSSAWALCHRAAGDMNFAHLLVIAPDRVVVQFEEQSLIELR
jgi:hypothetical protein